MESEIIMEEGSPVSNIQALVEKTDKTYYFEEKVAFCKKFWNYFDTEYWSEVQESHLKTLDNFFGAYEKYYAIDGGNFPPKALITGRKDGVIYGITAGVSMIPMPKVEMSYQDNYTEYRRMELGFACTEEED